MKEKINELESYSDGVIDDVAYPQLLIKVCKDKNYTLPKNRLTPFQIAYISAKTDRSITKGEAVAALRWVISNELNWHLYFVRNPKAISSSVITNTAVSVSHFGLFQNSATYRRL